MLTRLSTLFILLCLISCGGNDCDIRDLEVTVGDCSCEDAYVLTLDFIAEGSDSEFFELFARNGVLIGYYKISDLPITIDKFEMSGLSDDYIKIRLNEDEACTAEYEFFPPDCTEEEEDCLIEGLEVDLGECLSDTEYKLEIDFQYQNPGNEFFDVFVRNDELIGFFKLSDLPVAVTDFVTSGEDYDFIKVCINDNPACCLEIEFMPPECLEGECQIFDLVADVGECTSENSYDLTLNFEYTNPSHSNFEVFVRNNVRIGNYPLSELPLDISNFEMSGNDYDFIKVCMSDDPDCCKAIEFMPPECEAGECEIFDLEVEVKECTSDSTYNLVLDFEYENPGNEYFDVFIREGVFLDFFKLSDLPVELIDFPISGKDYDFIKVCINDVPDCCKETEFMPPNC